MPGVFAQAGMEYAYEHDGVGFEQFAKVAEKNHAHSTLNPLAHYQKQFSLDEVMDAEMMSVPEHAAHVLPEHRRVGRGRARERGEAAHALEGAAAARGEDQRVGADHRPVDRARARCSPTSTRSRATPRRRRTRLPASIPQDLDLVELHDCFATAELIHYDNLELCKPGEAGKFIDERGPWRDGKIPVNVSGGLISKGHPIGATGIANVYEVDDAPARRGRRPSDRGRQGRPHARHRPRLRVRGPRPREGRRLNSTVEVGLEDRAVFGVGNLGAGLSRRERATRRPSGRSRARGRAPSLRTRTRGRTPTSPAASVISRQRSAWMTAGSARPITA